jgi:hypothetical protein
VPQKPLSKELMQQAVDLKNKHGSITKASAAAGIPRETLQARVNRAQRAGVLPQSRGVDDPGLLKAKIKRLESDLKKAQSESADAAAIKDAIGAIKTRIDSLDLPTWALAPLAKPSSPGVPLLFLSDFHWGEVVHPSQINGVNKFNLAIAQERLRYTVDTAIHLLTILDSKRDYPGIVVPLGGDMISGNIHDELTATNELNTMPTVLDLYGHLVAAITRLADVFGAVFLPCVSGNHGRDTRKMWGKDRHHTSFDWLTYRFLAKHFENDRRVTFFIPDSSDALFRIFTTRFLLTHGDQFRGGDSIIGALGPLTRGNQKKQARNQAIGAEFDVMLCGHWHQYIHISRLIVNGALKGYDEYAYQNNFGFEEPQQALFVVHPRHGITFRMPVNCEQKPAPRKAEWVSAAASFKPRDL